MDNNLILSALANQTRLRLICCLGESKKNVRELISTCSLSQSAISQHLAKLRKSGLVSTKRNGTEIYYTLASKKTAKIANSILSLITK